MFLIRLPGVYEPQDDTRFLLDCVLAEGLVPGLRVLDVGTGTGRLALELKRAGATRVSAMDISRRAVWSTRVNAVVNRLPVQVRRGDLLTGAVGRFDLIVANPPYVPCVTGAPGAHSRARAWDAGADGRFFLDRICTQAPGRLRPRGVLWLVHSALCDPNRTLDELELAGLPAQIVAKERIPFGPVLRSRLGWLREQCLVGPDQQTEELVVIRAARTV